MDAVKLPKVALPKVTMPRHRMVAKPSETFPDWFKETIVLWYDPKRQGDTNEDMIENPVLKDLSGNNRHATCYNFAWSEASGLNNEDYLCFDGINDYVECKSEFTLTDFTLIVDRKDDMGTQKIIRRSQLNRTGLESVRSRLMEMQQPMASTRLQAQRLVGKSFPVRG